MLLNRYAELLTEHPGLSITITGLADTKTDRAILQKVQEEIEQQRVDTLNKKGLAAYQKKQQEIQAAPPGKTIKEESIPKKDLAGYKPVLANSVHISDEVLLELAAERSLLVYDFFVHSLNIEPRRLSIKDRKRFTVGMPANGARLDITTSAKAVQ